MAAGGAALAAVSVSRWSVNITFLTHYTHHEDQLRGLVVRVFDY